MIRKDYSWSKTAVPKLFHKLLPRKKIAAIINNAPLDEAICLIAPYGCGKTMSVISWLRENRRDAAWLTLDESDNSQKAFFAGLSAAIMRLNGWQGSLDEILSDPRYTDDPQSFLWRAISAAEENSRDKILVIDRFQFIRDPGLRCSAKDFISALLGHWRVIIISRAELPSVFNDLLLKRRICLISLQELNFNLEEITEFFSISGFSVPQGDMIRIRDETGGWPAALNVILILSRGKPVSYSESARAYLMGFFETEIWNNLNEDIKDFLLKTSVLDKLTPASCNAVTDRGETLSVLRGLFVNGVFIFRLDKADTYRYHRVFRNYLLDKLKLHGIDKKPLYKKFAWWLFERDDYEQAFTYFFKGGDLYGLSRVLRIINIADMGIERYLELVGCITSLNVDDLRSYPLIVAKMAIIHYALGNVAEMQRLYGIFLGWIRPGALPLSPEEYAECMWEAGWLSYLNPAEPVSDWKKHEEWFNYAEYDPNLKRLHQARAAVFRFPSMLRGIRDHCPILNTLDEYLLQSPLSDEVSLWRPDIVRAEYAYELENFALSEDIIRSVMPEFEKQQLTDLYFVCIALLVKIVRAVHDPKEIGMMISRVEMMIHKNNHSFLLPRFHAFELRNRLADGIAGQTEVFEKENKAYAEKPYFYLLYRHMTLARALLSTGNYNEAIILLGSLETICHQYNRIMDMIEVNILKAIAEFALGNEDGACRYLLEAINEAREYGFIRIFSDEAKDIWPVLEIIGKQNKDAYVKRIIISCKKTLARAGIKLNRKKGTSDELTRTELKILKALATEMSYKEIAFDNNIKLSTVKSHIHSIYSKLGANSRGTAVMTAKSMGLINTNLPLSSR